VEVEPCWEKRDPQVEAGEPCWEKRDLQVEEEPCWEKRDPQVEEEPCWEKRDPQVEEEPCWEKRDPQVEEEPCWEKLDLNYVVSSGITVGGYKPRQLIRKRKKCMVPTDEKDISYWERRKKNNESARRSREAKKEKEKGFYLRSLELEYENMFLKERITLLETKLSSQQQGQIYNSIATVHDPSQQCSL
jgi:hypothetical protein